MPALFPRGVSVVFLFVGACGGETGGTASPGGAGAGGAATAGGGGSTAGTQGTAGATGKGGAGPSVGGSGGVGGTGAGAGGGAAGGSGTGGSTSLGAPMTLVDGQSHPSRLALDTGFVYFTNRGSLTMGSMDGALVKVSKSGGVATVLLASLPQPSGLVLGPSGLVFATTGDSAVSQIQTNGSGAITLGKATSPVIALAGAGATLVVGEANGQVASVTGAGIVALAMVPSSPDHIALDGDAAIVTSSQTDAMGVPSKTGALTSVSVSTGVATPLATGLFGPGGVVIVGSDALVAEIGSGAIRRFPLKGGAPSELATGQGNPRALAADALYAYWANLGTTDFTTCVAGSTMGAILRAPLAGGPPEVIAAAEACPIDIVVDASGVYWANAGNTAGAGAVRAVKKQ